MRLSTSLTLTVDFLHVMYIKDKQTLVFNYIFDLLWTVRGSPLSSVAFCKADSHIACRVHAVPMPCRAAKGLDCVFPI
jgi:hypothetical protein